MARTSVAQERLFARRHLADKVADAAIALLGATLIHQTPHGTLAGVIVETEAYDASEPACHAFRGRTPLNGNLFAQAGTAYVYISYGMHWCVNVATGRLGHGAAVLVRALRPTQGVDEMFRLRHRKRAVALTERTVCRGPGNLSQALGIDRRNDGAQLLSAQSSLRLLARPRSLPEPTIMASPRIGITRATELMWRYFYADCPYVSGSRSKGAQVVIESA